ncbi:MAG: hypothetical protein HY959_03865 [Ignavibacteriae bacterium]|nr:hypothetical protein [Ignavibacteriota bacterium]
MKEFKPVNIQITKIQEEKMSILKGSLLIIPIGINSNPPHEWINFFIDYFNNPTSFTSHHRPGIANVIGNEIILNGTTVDEIEKCHRTTIIEAVNRANESYNTYKRAEIEKENQKEEAERRKLSEEQNKAKNIKF